MNEITTNKTPDVFEKNFYLFKKVSLKDKVNFYEYLSIMLDGWVSIIEALESAKQKIENKYFVEKIWELSLFVSSGDSLNKAMKKMPDVFGASEFSLVEAWEKSGTLIESLASLAVESEKLYELRQKIKSALTYPFIIVLFLVAAVVIVMTYVIPNLLPMIDDADAEKPFATTTLIATSNFLSNNVIVLILFILILVVLFLAYKTTDSGRKTLDALYLRLPLVGKVYQNYLLASSISTLGILLHSGIPVIKSLGLVGKSFDNASYEELFDKIAFQVGAGKKIADTMQDLDPDGEYFPLDFVQLLSVWEKTASVDVVCKKLNQQYTREVQYSLANMTKWIEPIAILFAGLFVAWFAFAIFGAIINLTQSIG